MTTPIDSFFPWVLPMVPGCSDPMAIQAIRSAANDFCVRSDLIQQVIVADCTAGSQDYTITPPAEMEFCKIMSVSWQGRVLSPVSPQLVMQDIVLRGTTVGTAVPTSGSPTWFFQKTPTSSALSLYPIPDTTLAQGLTVKVSFNPTNTAATLDDTLFNDWVDEIGAGALSTLMAMPGQRWSNPTLSLFYSQQYRDGLGRARRQANSGKLPASLRVLPQPWAI